MGCFSFTLDACTLRWLHTWWTTFCSENTPISKPTLKRLNKHPLFLAVVPALLHRKKGWVVSCFFYNQKSAAHLKVWNLTLAERFASEPLILCPVMAGPIFTLLRHHARVLKAFETKKLRRFYVGSPLECLCTLPNRCFTGWVFPGACSRTKHEPWCIRWNQTGLDWARAGLGMGRESVGNGSGIGRNGSGMGWEWVG